jgi:hypothetical protein
MLAPEFFRTRSEAGDRYADEAIVMEVVKSIDTAVNAFRSERDGLGRRISEALSGTAVPASRATGECAVHLADTSRAGDREAEIANAQRRLDQLDSTIAQFEWLRSEITARFSFLVSAQKR